MSGEINVSQAPEEMRAYLAKLIKVCGYQEPVEIGIIAASDMPARVGVTDHPDGFLHIVPGKVPLIILRDNIAATRWQSVVAHEFLHVLRWTMDSFVLHRLPKDEHHTYMRLVENTMKPLSILLIVGALINAEWIEGEATDGAQTDL